jgi:F-type H+-transporting ATPase subunit b
MNPFLLSPLVTPEIGLLFWQVVTFLIVLFILAKFAWKPIMTSLKERENSIDEALSAAKKAKEEMLKLSADNEKLLAEARLERDRILRDAQTASNTMITEAKDKAQAEGQRMIENARLAIITEKQAALTEVKNLAANLSIEIAEKILKRELADENAQKELVNEFIKEANVN